MNMQDLWNNIKRPILEIRAIKEREAVQVKCTENILNKIAEFFPNLENVLCRYRSLLGQKTDNTSKNQLKDIITKV
jgi:hypothetical protein